MFSLIPYGNNFNIVKYRVLWMTISIIGVGGSLVLLGTKGLNYGIDFTGGSEVHVRVPTDWNTEALRGKLREGGLGTPAVVQVGDPSGHEYLIRAQGSEAEITQIEKKIADIFATQTKPGEAEIYRSDIVGPAAGRLLRKNGLLAAIYALLAILIYVGIRFDWRYAPGAVLALFHDSVIVLGVFVLTQKQFDLTILAAILALIGYSNNDTVVVFDRVRETCQIHPDWSIEKAVNVSVNETLARTIMTSLVTFIVVAAIFFLGGPVLENFAFSLLCGIVAGSYSSIFIASTLVISFTNLQESRDTRSKQHYKKKKVYEVRAEPKA